MPIYVINTRAELAAFYPYLRHLYEEDEMFHVLRIQHSEENCTAGSEPVLNGAYSFLHLIYLHPTLVFNMRQLLAHLNRISPPLNPNDPRNFLNCLMMCPSCGKVYADQTNRSSRSSQPLIIQPRKATTREISLQKTLLKIRPMPFKRHGMQATI